MLSPRSLPHVPNTMTKLSYRAFPAAPGSSVASRWVHGPSRPSLLRCVSLGGVRVPLLCQPPPQPGAMPRSDHPAPHRCPLPGRAAPCPQVVRGCCASLQAACPSTFTWTTINVSPGRLLKSSRLLFIFPLLLLIIMINRSVGRVSIFLIRLFKRNRSAM